MFPADMLYIGEAPGKVENQLGKPFVGPSGKLLDAMHAEAVSLFPPEAVEGITVGVTNVVSCIPWDDPKKRSGVRPPTKEEAAACAPRLAETIRLARPRLICLLGLSAYAHWDAVQALAPQATLVKLDHPAYVIRHGAGPSVPRSKFIHTLAEALRDTLVLRN